MCWQCRFDNKAAKLPSVVKPGDLGLMFSDSTAKGFNIEIDRVKVLCTLFQSLH